MPRIEVSEVIERPPEEVWDVVADPSRSAEWRASTTAVETLTEGTLREGARLRETSRFLGRSLVFELEITAFDPPHRMRTRTLSGPFQTESTLTLEPDGDGTHIRYEAHADAGLDGSFGALVDPVIAGAFRRESRSDLRRLKDLLERRTEREK